MQNLNFQKRATYDLSEIPEWCNLPIAEHQCAGGCWGILYGEVKAKGLEYCNSCLLKNKDWQPKDEK